VALASNEALQPDRRAATTSASSQPRYARFDSSAGSLILPWSIASGLCEGDIIGFYYVRFGIAKIAFVPLLGVQVNKRGLIKA
jgi:hypothetical protein